MSGLLDEEYFKNNFNTALSPEQEASFLEWANKNNRSGDVADYDLRGYWLNNGLLGANGHLTDQYKKPNHPTFSDQSKYNGAAAPFGTFVGGTWDQTGNGYSYTPSAEMLKNTHPLNWLQGYMNRFEPNVVLNMDKRKK